MPRFDTAAAIGSIASATSTTTLAAANQNRRGLSIYNASTAVLFVCLGPSASPSNYSAQVAPGGTWTDSAPVYTGLVTGVWASANGTAQVTEKS